MKTKLVFIQRQIQIAIEDENNNAIAFMQIFINGNTGTLYSLSGKYAFRALVENYNDILNYCKIDRTLIVMEKETLKRLISIVPINFGFIIKEQNNSFFAGKNMIECEIIKR